MKRTNPRLAFLSCIALALILGSHTALAATWTGGTPGDQSCAQFTNNNLWSIPCNWSGKVAPAAGDDLTLGAGLIIASVNNYASGTVFNSLALSGAHIASGSGINLMNGITATGGVIQFGFIALGGNQTFGAPNVGAGAIISSPIATAGKRLTFEGAGEFVLTGIVSGAGELRKFGRGTVRLTGNNTYTGATLVFDGTLVVAGLQPQSNVSISGDNPGFPIRTRGILAGTGTVGAVTLTDDAVLDPGPAGNGTGILTASDVTVTAFATAAELRTEIKGRVPGTEYDRLRIGADGSLDLGDSNGASLIVTLAGGFVPTPGDTFLIVDIAGPSATSGTFSGLPEGALFTVGGSTFQISYRGGDGNDVTLRAVSGAVAFTASSYSVNEGDGTASITLRRTGGGNTTAAAGVALENVTTNFADYVSRAGKVDTSFNSAATVARVSASALQPDGKIIIGGDFSDPDGDETPKNIERLNADGSLDATFNVGSGVGAAAAVKAIVVQPDGKILIAGSFASYNGTPRANIARLNSDGSLDASFDPAAGANDIIRDIALQTDGKIIIAGAFTQYRGVARRCIARVHADGSLDTTFAAAAGSGSANIRRLDVHAVSIDAHGRIVTGGDFGSFDGVERAGIARLNRDGTLDPSFDPGSGVSFSEVLALGLQSDGKVVIGGTFSSYNGIARRRVARIESDGSLDPSFHPKQGPNGNVEVLAVQSDGKVIIGGGFSAYADVARAGLARVGSDGSLDLTFDPGSGTNHPDGVESIVQLADGRIIVGGIFDQYEGVPQRHVARVRGDVVATWGPNDFDEKTVQLPIIDDAFVEGTEKLNLRIVPLSGATTGSPAVAELTIMDNGGETSPTSPSQPLNISTRLRVETGSNVMIGGFIIIGSDPKKVIIRALGPSLQNAGVDDAVRDPVLELRGSDAELIFANDNWRDAQQSDIEASTVPPPNDLEAAIVATLPPGAYTAVVTGKNGTTGVGLIEAYDLDQAADSALANISTRGLVLTDTNVLIGGFILGGSNEGTRVVVRALGPSLSSAGVANPLQNPTLDLRDGNGDRLFFNDDWKDDPAQAAELITLGIAPPNDIEAAIVARTPPGSYTAIVSGTDGGVGVGLVEVYNVK